MENMKADAPENEQPPGDTIEKDPKPKRWHINTKLSSVFVHLCNSLQQKCCVHGDDRQLLFLALGPSNVYPRQL